MNPPTSQHIIFGDCLLRIYMRNKLSMYDTFQSGSYIIILLHTNQLPYKPLRRRIGQTVSKAIWIFNHDVYVETILSNKTAFLKYQ